MTSESQTTIPYEAALGKAFDRLTSQIFIFLLAYTILLAGLAFLGSGISESIRTLLYIIPVLGVLAYGWEQKRKIAKEAADHGVRLGVLFASDRAYVGGVRGSAGGEPQNVSLGAGVVRGDAQVVGVDTAPPDADRQSPVRASNEEFWNIYDKLTQENRNEVKAGALQLYAEQLRSK
jgi:hypothetical protein